MREYERRSRWTPWHVLAILLVLAALVVVLFLVYRLTESAARGQVAAGPTMSPPAGSGPPQPSATDRSATTQPAATQPPIGVDPTAVATFSPPPRVPIDAPPIGGHIGPDRTAITVTDDLRVRSLPEVSERSTLLDPLLGEGQPLYVTAGPVEGSGYRWYEVYAPGPDVGGWVAAAGKDGEAWIQRRPADCTLGASDDPFVDELGYWLMHLACFKDDEFGGQRILAAVQDDGLRCPDVVLYWLEPTWLNDHVSCSYEFYLPDPDTGAVDFVSDGVFHPDVRDTAARLVDAAPDPRAGVTVEVTGRLDHPDALDCRAVGDHPPIRSGRPSSAGRCLSSPPSSRQRERQQPGAR